MKCVLVFIVVGVSRVFWDWIMRLVDNLWKRYIGYVDLILLIKKVVYDVWVLFDGIIYLNKENIEVIVRIRFILVVIGKDILFDIFELKIVLIKLNGVIDILLSLEFNWGGKQEELIVIYVLFWINNEKVSSDCFWLDFIKYLDLSERGFCLEYLVENEVMIWIMKLVKGFVFLEKEGVKLRDNGFDVVLGEIVMV